MFLFSQCAFASEMTVRSSRRVEQCPHRAAFIGSTSDDVVTLACPSHEWLLKHSTAILGCAPVGEETLAQVAANQAAMEELLRLERNLNMPTRRRQVSIIPLPSKAVDAGMLIADATDRYSDARLELVDGTLVITSAKQAGE